MSISLQEISIIIAAKDLSPSILNPEFLQYSDIVPSDWQYDQQPVITNGGHESPMTTVCALPLNPIEWPLPRLFPLKISRNF